MYFSAIVLFIIGIAIWLHRAQAAPWVLYAGVFAHCILGAIALSILTRLAPVATWCLYTQSATDQTVVYTPVSTSLLLPILGTFTVLAIPALLWFQERFGAMYHPSLTRWLIWPFLIGLLFFNLVALVLVQSVTLTTDATDLLNSFQKFGAIVGLLSIPALYLLSLISFLRWFRNPR